MAPNTTSAPPAIEFEDERSFLERHNDHLRSVLTPNRVKADRVTGFRGASSASPSSPSNTTSLFEDFSRGLTKQRQAAHSSQQSPMVAAARLPSPATPSFMSEFNRDLNRRAADVRVRKDALTAGSVGSSSAQGIPSNSAPDSFLSGFNKQLTARNRLYAAASQRRGQDTTTSFASGITTLFEDFSQGATRNNADARRVKDALTAGSTHRAPSAGAVKSGTYTTWRPSWMKVPSASDSVRADPITRGGRVLGEGASDKVLFNPNVSSLFSWQRWTTSNAKGPLPARSNEVRNAYVASGMVIRV